jgi:hypothetical protein
LVGKKFFKSGCGGAKENDHHKKGEEVELDRKQDF